jgi:tetratricopeptide (TPR) repeat protein
VISVKGVPPYSWVRRLLYFITILPLVTFRALPVQSQDSPGDRQLDAAVAAWQRSDVDGARKLVEDYLAQHPRSAAAWNLKGMIDDAQKDFSSGGKDFETALRLAPSASIYTNLGNHYLLLQDPVRARQAFGSALRLDPHHFSARFNLLSLVLDEAPCRQTQGQGLPQAFPANLGTAAPPNHTSRAARQGEAQPACAQEALALVKGLAPKDLERPEVALLQVRALLAAGQPSSAVSVAQRAMAHSPRDCKLAYSLGLELAQAGDARCAVPFLERAESLLPPHQPDANLLLDAGLVKFRAGLPAASEFLRLKQLQPAWWQPDYYLGLMAGQAKQYLQASAWLVKAQQLAPNEPLVAAALANTAAVQGFWFDAVDEWQHYIDLKPHDLRAYRELAIVAGVARRYELAVSTMRQYLRTYSDDAEAYYMLALMERDGGHDREAVEALHTCVRLKPYYVPAWTTLGKVEINLGELESAKEHLKRALEINPRHAPAHLALAQIENRQGHPELALPLLQQAVKEDPNDAVSYYQLATRTRPRRPEPHSSTCTNSTAAKRADEDCWSTCAKMSI